MISYANTAPARFRLAQPPRTTPPWLRRDEGGMTVFILFAFVTMLLVAGIAVDMMRMEHERVRMQGASDRAVLAAAALRGGNQIATPGAIADSFLRAEGLEGFVEERVTITDLGSVREVQVIPAARIASSFMRMLGVNSMDVATPATAIEALGQIDFEIVLVLDVSGSMMDVNRIQNLRTATINFVESMVGAGEPGQVAISFVPYSTEVILPPAVMNRLTNLGAASNIKTWDIDEAGYTILNSDGQPTWHHDDSCIDFGDWPNVRNMVSESRFRPWVRRYCNEWSNTEFSTPMVRPMVGDLNAMRSYVNSLEPVWGTSIDLGIRVGAMFFDPTMQPAITDMINLGQIDPVFAGRPFNLDRANVVRAMILLTDGENCCYYEWHPSTRFATPEQQDLATTDSCAGLRDMGVTIYSIAFEAPQRGIDVMTDCASSSNHFFNASAAGVIDAFQAIGTHIQRQSLRLTQ